MGFTFDNKAPCIDDSPLVNQFCGGHFHFLTLGRYMYLDNSDKHLEAIYILSYSLIIFLSFKSLCYS